jgi:hypothetical protein
LLKGYITNPAEKKQLFANKFSGQIPEKWCFNQKCANEKRHGSFVEK